MFSRIEISDDVVTIDGRVYRRESSVGEMWGRKEIALYLGFKRKDGKANMSNLYDKTKPSVVACFPDFEIDKADHNARPWSKEKCIKWLSIPKRKRIEMYLESLDS